MKREISSKDTFFYKIILPVFLLICAAVLPVAVYLYDPKNNLVSAIFVLIFSLISAALVFVMTKALKKLTLDDGFLYVSNYRKEIIIPLSNIDKILWFGDVRPTMIYLKTPSEYGKKINFQPKISVSYNELNPIVEELKELTKQSSKI